MRKAVFCLFLILSSCSSASEKQAAPELQCQEASERLGELACVHRIPDDGTFQSVAVALERVDQLAAAKFMVPARSDARLRPVILNSKLFELHIAFLTKAFTELFPNLTTKEYLDLLFDPERREYYVGSITKYRSPSGEERFAVTVSSDPARPESVGCTEVRAAYSELSSRIQGLPLVVVPEYPKQETWLSDCGVPVYFPSKDISYEAYHPSVGFGTVRRFTAAEFPSAVQNVAFGFQDIVVLEEAPPDIETVVSGSVTGTRQAPLSHLAVRSASRGTPNCYQKGAYDYLKAWEGKLVRLECGADTLSVRTASLEEAEQFWQSKRPKPVPIEKPDYQHTELVPLESLPLQTAEERQVALSRFGAKGKNLAWLTQNIPAQYTPPGFLIPMSYYKVFVEQNGWKPSWQAGATEQTFAQTITELASDPLLKTDLKLQRERLTALQSAMLTAPCDANLIAAIQQTAQTVWNNDSTMVRFRSSSNAEDGAIFNGAGLYDSISACVADEMDSDERGPSRCDPTQNKERSVCRALKTVWASLWNPKAYAERSYYGIDQLSAGMAILVSERVDREKANFVAFSGNPIIKGDARYLVNAQFGELEVVSPPPGVWPEQSLLTIDAGKVSAITRAAPSSEAPDGSYVLTDEQLKVVGAELAKIAASYPFDTTAPTGHELLLDTEWKVLESGALLIKQVRPYLR